VLCAGDRKRSRPLETIGRPCCGLLRSSASKFPHHRQRH
jgi:hypothetical protein